MGQALIQALGEKPSRKTCVFVTVLLMEASCILKCEAEIIFAKWEGKCHNSVGNIDSSVKYLWSQSWSEGLF